jgi:hypothetical protein
MATHSSVSSSSSLESGGGKTARGWLVDEEGACAPGRLFDDEGVPGRRCSRPMPVDHARHEGGVAARVVLCREL